MKKLLLSLVMLFALTSAVGAADLFDLRVFPQYEDGTVGFAGTIVSSSLKENPTSRRNNISGLLGRWIASSSVTIETSDEKVITAVKDGEFSGTIKVASMASFTLSVQHLEEKLHQETFNFPEKIDYLAVSDIDDTILVTEVTNRVKMTYNSLFTRAENRQPVTETPEFYRQLASGALQLGTPHIIYLSSSPTFLSRQIKAFIANNRFPCGTIILKKSLTSGAHQSHKSGWLEKISTRFPGKPLLLLGDSGEQDPFIYRSFAEIPANTALVKAIIIHEVTGDPETIATLEMIKSDLLKIKVPFIFWNSIEQLKVQLQQNQLLK